ncbi:hypothetical protein BH11PAT2_BH11PAT2_08760 [soil metagenome]
MIWILVIIVVVIIAVLMAIFGQKYLKPPVVWKNYSFPGISLQLPNTDKVETGITYTDMRVGGRKDFPYTAYAFHGEQRTGFDSGAYYAQNIVLMVFPTQDFVREVEPVLTEDHFLKEYTNTWKDYANTNAFESINIFDRNLKLVKETEDYKLFLYDRRTDETVLFLASKTKPYVIELQYWPNIISTDEEIVRIEKIEESVSVQIPSKK